MRKALLIFIFSVMCIAPWSQAGLVLGTGVVPYLLSGAQNWPSTGTGHFLSLTGGRNACAAATEDESYCANVMPNSGTITDMYIGLAAPPGSGGDVWAYTLQKCPNNAGVPDYAGCLDADTNWENTDITCSVTDSVDKCTDSGTSAFVRGDMYVVEVVGTNTPLNARIKIGFRIIPTIPNETVVTGILQAANGSNGRRFGFRSGFGKENTSQYSNSLIPTGVIKDCIMVSQNDIAATKSRTFTMEEGLAGTNNAVVLTFDENERVDEDTTNIITLSTVDHVGWETDPTNSPAEQRFPWGCTFIPGDVGTSFSSTTTAATASPIPEYAMFSHQGTPLSYSNIDAPFPKAFTIHDVWAAIQVDPVSDTVHLGLYADTVDIGVFNFGTGDEEALGGIQGPTALDTAMSVDNVVVLKEDETGSPTHGTFNNYVYTQSID